MKKIILSVAVIVAMGFTSCKNDNKAKKEETKTEISNEMAVKEASFGVRGNCGMCKTTIEKAVNEIDGVSKANWHKDKKKIDVSFDASKTDVMTIHKAIANSGYDTDKMEGDKEAYKELAGCCKYDHDMKMSIE